MLQSNAAKMQNISRLLNILSYVYVNYIIFTTYTQQSLNWWATGVHKGSLFMAHMADMLKAECKWKHCMSGEIWYMMCVIQMNYEQLKYTISISNSSCRVTKTLVLTLPWRGRGCDSVGSSPPSTSSPKCSCRCVRTGSTQAQPTRGPDRVLKTHPFGSWTWLVWSGSPSLAGSPCAPCSEPQCPQTAERHPPERMN